MIYRLMEHRLCWPSSASTLVKRIARRSTSEHSTLRFLLSRPEPVHRLPNSVPGQPPQKNFLSESHSEQQIAYVKVDALKVPGGAAIRRLLPFNEFGSRRRPFSAESHCRQAAFDLAGTVMEVGFRPQEITLFWQDDVLFLFCLI